MALPEWDHSHMSKTDVIFIGGRAGVGKSTVAFAMHEQLTAQHIRHAVIEGDALDLAWPPPWEHHLAARNLAAIWANYHALGYRRLIYTNTVAILELDALVEALGGECSVTSILLRADDDTIATRLGQREQGASLTTHLERSAKAASLLDETAPVETHRIQTNGLRPSAIAHQILKLAGWTLDKV